MKQYVHYLTIEQHYNLDMVCSLVRKSLPDNYGLFLVGSVLTKPDWRDVDIRCIMPNETFAQLFPKSKEPVLCSFQSLLHNSISCWIRNTTQLPIDFQIQSMKYANSEFPSQYRNGIGMNQFIKD